ncbi:MAG: fluoride efflux transporter CrcB [Rhizobiaceae bacterium]
MYHILFVAVGGACGAVMRHLCNLAALRMFGPGFPWGTLFVNVLGSLLMGLLVGWLVRRTGGNTNELRLLLATGFLGGFTTFSAFSLDFVALWRDGPPAIAISYAVASVVISLLAIFTGLWLIRIAA